MADTVTPNYKWVQPQVGADAATWGATINTDLAAIDAQVYANQQAGLPVGSMAMFAGATPPTNWLNCDGSSLSTTGIYAALFAVIGYAFGGSGANFNLPNLQGAFPIGLGGAYALGAKGGEATHLLTGGEMPAHNHVVNDAGHQHGVTDPTHIHGVGDPWHTHGVNDPTHFHSGGYSNTGGGVPQNQVGGALGNTGSSATGITIAAAGSGISIQAHATGVQIQANITGVTTQNVGGGAAHNNLPPYVCVNFIIRFQ